MKLERFGEIRIDSELESFGIWKILDRKYCKIIGFKEIREDLKSFRWFGFIWIRNQEKLRNIRKVLETRMCSEFETFKKIWQIQSERFNQIQKYSKIFWFREIRIASESFQKDSQSKKFREIRFSKNSKLNTLEIWAKKILNR